MPRVILVMGSASDLPTLKGFIKVMRDFGIDFKAQVLSAHRTPHAAAQLASSAEESGVQVICAAAGKAAHLAGVMAAHTIRPVIGIPIKSSTLDGLDALLSIVQMPAGVPVATVAIDGAQNAALLAIQMLALGDEDLARKLHDYKKTMNEAILAADAKLQEEINDYV